MSADLQDLYTASAQPKFSRYRSVRSSARRFASGFNAEQAVDDRNAIQQDGGLKKSPSRYRRPSGKSELDHTDPVPSLPRAAILPKEVAHNSRMSSGRDEGFEHAQVRTEPAPVGGTRGKIAQRSDLERRAPLEELEAEFKAQGQRHAHALESAREVGREEAKRVREGEGIQRAKTVPLGRKMSDGEAAEILGIQKRKDLERLERELDAANASPPGVKSPPKERFHLFSRKRGTVKHSPPSSAPISRRSSSNGLLESTKHQAAVPEKPQHIEIGGKGIVPGIDAPISAVNAGERRVLVRCKQSSINLPVTPTTTPTEIIYTAANVLTQDFDPTKAILLESYAKLGLERGIRKYEHIRDVMNSWDRDTQNAFILETSPTTLPISNPLSNPAYLDPDYVSPETPDSITVCLYHSQKPGKWNKRHVTLLSTGQIYISKNSNSKSSDKDYSNICHLSDFDIFVPTSSQVRKSLKPPKKICYAIKSQQKTSFFESTTNFVHFFATDDERMARKWWSAVQKWRSWYLLHKRSGNKKDVDIAAKDTAVKDTSTGFNKGRSNSDDSKENGKTPYTIGSFEPLLGTADFSNAGRRRSRTMDAPSSRQMNEESETPSYGHNISPKSSSRSKYPPISSAISKIRSNSSSLDESSSNSSNSSTNQTFSAKGLLGRAYSIKQKEVMEKENAEKNHGPFVEGNSLLNTSSHNTGAGLSTRTSIKRPSMDGERPKTSAHTTSNNIQRSNTMRTTTRPKTSSERTRTMTGSGSGTGRIPPVPLVDLTPKVLEAKQWSREGKGHGVKAPEGTLLVEIARSRDLDDEEGLAASGVRKVAVPRGYEPRIGGKG